MSKKSKNILTVLGLILLIAVVSIASYALWVITVEQKDPNTISTGCFDITLTSESEAIKLLNAFPISNEDGMNTKPYTFLVENTCTIDAKYVINLETYQDNTLASNYVKAVIDQNTPGIITNYKKANPTLDNTDSYQLLKGSLNAHEKQTFSLRLWMDQDTPETEQNKTFRAKIVVEAGMTTPEVYADASGAEAPELDNGLIPVIWHEERKEWIKVSIYDKWYDYGEQWWANAVTVSAQTRDKYTNAEDYTSISMDDIETMWVWVPRYEYQHTNLGDQYAGGTKELPGAITINFISKETTTPSSDNFTIHDAFWWDDNNDSNKDPNEQLSGIWVAKFEMSPTDTICKSSASTANCNKLQSINIKPNVSSWRYAQIGTMWTAIYNNMNGSSNQYGLTNSDAHLMKNIEWGAVAYLSQSKYGKKGNTTYTTDADREIYQNKSSSYITGMSNGTPGTTTTNIQIPYNVEKDGTGASTTGNIYGIYDMSGGANEYVMGIQKVNGFNEPAVGYVSSSNSGWSGKLANGDPYPAEGDTTTQTYGSLNNDVPKRYYDLYEYGTDYFDYTRGHLGDATKEVSGWYSDSAFFAYSLSPFFTRGGSYGNATNTGVFYFYGNIGNAYSDHGGRPVLVKQP